MSRNRTESNRSATSSPFVSSMPTPRPSSESVFVAPKRDSPLDLSVKTVKTKADSSGQYDQSSSHFRRDELPTPNSLMKFHAPPTEPNPMHGHIVHQKMSNGIQVRMFDLRIFVVFSLFYFSVEHISMKKNILVFDLVFCSQICLM